MKYKKSNENLLLILYKMIILIIATVSCLDINLTNLQFNYYSLPISANNITYNLLVDNGNEDMWIFGKNSNRRIYYEC